MDIPANMKRLPLEDRLEATACIRFLSKCGLFDSIIHEMSTEVLQAAMVLAHNRDYEPMERTSIRTATVFELLDGLKQAATEQENSNG